MPVIVCNGPSVCMMHEVCYVRGPEMPNRRGMRSYIGAEPTGSIFSFHAVGIGCGRKARGVSVVGRRHV